MNIQQYYQTLAGIFLNGSLAAFVPVFFIIAMATLWIPGRDVWLFSAPFLLYSFISYQNYMINRNRSERSVVRSNKSYGQPLVENQYLLAFLPAPSLRMLLFSVDGLVNCELRDTNNSKIRWFLPYFLDRLFPAEYGIYTKEEKPLYKIRWKKRKAFLYDEDGNVLLTVEKLGKELFILSSERKTQQIEVSVHSFQADLQFTTSRHELLGRMRKGWMPLEWGKSFQNANTPVITFSTATSDEMKLAILTIMVYLYRYREH